jgi:hypothetical protein
MNETRYLIFPLALSLAVLGSCSGESEAVDYTPGTPREALVEFNNAIRDLDKERARSWVMPGELQDEFFGVTYGMSEMLSGFKRRYIEVYGEDALTLLQNPPGAQLDYMDTHADAERLNSMIIDAMGDVAYAKFPDGQTMRVLRTQGKWRVDAVGTDDPAQVEQIRAILGPQMVLAQILNDATRGIGKDGMTAEKFDYKLGRIITTSFENLQRQAEQAIAAPGFGGPETGTGASVPPAANQGGQTSRPTEGS